MSTQHAFVLVENFLPITLQYLLANYEVLHEILEKKEKDGFDVKQQRLVLFLFYSTLIYFLPRFHMFFLQGLIYLIFRKHSKERIDVIKLVNDEMIPKIVDSLTQYDVVRAELEVQHEEKERLAAEAAAAAMSAAALLAEKQREKEERSKKLRQGVKDAADAAAATAAATKTANDEMVKGNTSSPTAAKGAVPKGVVNDKIAKGVADNKMAKGNTLSPTRLFSDDDDDYDDDDGNQNDPNGPAEEEEGELFSQGQGQGQGRDHGHGKHVKRLKKTE